MPRDLTDPVWFTAHVRMRSERRFRIWGKVLNLLTVWYSTVLTCLTVYQLIAESNPLRDVASAALAVALLALSLFVPSLNLEQQADRFRECYLKLQRLLDEVSEPSLLNSAYYDILDAYPNHSPKDYTDFIVFSYLVKQPLIKAGSPLIPTKSMFIGFFARRLGMVIGVILAAAAPSLLYFLR